MAEDEPAVRKTVILRPGEAAPLTGNYESSLSGRRTTLRQGELAPVAPSEGEVWRLLDGRD